MFNDRKRRIEDLMRHQHAFRQFYITLPSTYTLSIRRAVKHDEDKLKMLKYAPLPVSWIRKIHKSTARHHNRRNSMDYHEALVDFEVARLTKRSKQQTAFEWIHTAFERGTLPKYDYEMFIIMLFVYKEYFEIPEELTEYQKNLIKAKTNIDWRDF